MKYEAKYYSLKLENPFGISRGTKTESPCVILKLDNGWGESAPYKLYGETPDSVLENMQILSKFEKINYEEFRPFIEKIYALLPHSHSTKTAIDLAVWDNVGKIYNLPVYKLLGLSPSSAPVSSYTIGIDTIDKMLEKTEKAKSYPILKLKVGFDNDIEVLKEIRKIYSGKIRVDANAAWTVDIAMEKMKKLADLNVEFVEQPLDKNDINGQAELFTKAPLPIILDESILNSKDVIKWSAVCHGINIKLMKCGGILEALKMIEIARGFDLKIMLGCMIESSIGISAAAQIAPLVDYIDLDGNVLITNDPFDGYKIDENGKFSYNNKPGLGITLKNNIKWEEL